MSAARSRARVLLGAFAFSPVRGSECAVGWNIATRLARSHDVTVITGDVASHERTRHELEEYFQKYGAVPGLTVEYVPPTAAIKVLERLHALPCAWMLYYEAYRRWQIEALAAARRLHAACPFDLCHQLTFIGYREPGYLYRLGIPFIWGPISGAENIPTAFFSAFKLHELFRPLSRNLGNALQMRLAGRPKEAARRSRAAFAVSQSEVDLLARWGASSDPLLETGTSPKAGASVRNWTGKEPLRIVWSGLFTPRKALPLLFHALSRMPSGFRYELHVLGDGPLWHGWKADAERMQIQNIIWHGRKSHAEAIGLMAHGHLLLHTGLREGTPHVVLEALSLGLPVVCHDAGGMGTAVNDRSGIKIPLVDPATSIRGLEAALCSFFADPGLVARLSSGALHRSSELSWDAIAETFHRKYLDILALTQA